MQDTDLCKQLLKLEEPWQVGGVSVDLPSARVDVQVGLPAAKKSLLGIKKAADCPRCHRALPPPEAMKHVVLRHLNMGGLRTFLNVPDPAANICGDTACVFRKWLCKPNSKLTLELENHVEQTLRLTKSVHATVKLLNLTTAEVSQVNERSGAVTAMDEAPAASRAAPASGSAGVAAAAVPAPAAAPAIALPAENNPIWQRLVLGEIAFPTTALNLRMLMEQVRQSVAQNPSDVTRAAGARVLRQFLGKYWQRHAAEFQAVLAQSERVGARTAGAAGVPEENHGAWQALIDGKLVLKTNQLALTMLLERVRLSLGSNLTPANRLAGARVLRQFFQKHQTRLVAELAQLGAVKSAGAAVVAAVPAGGLPAENDPVWGRWIRGEINVNTNAVGLNMLVERIRLSVGEVPTPSQILSGAKVLRQFFGKYQGRLNRELAQLSASASGPAAGTAAAAIGIPAEHDPSWQSWILGRVDIHTEAVGLSMLLERVRLTLGENPDPVRLQTGVRTLRQFFMKYGARLRNELEQLLRQGSGAVSMTTSSGQVLEFVEVPPENHPSWKRLIRGELRLDTDAISLKMLLERVRLSLAGSDNDASLNAGARILRQYFIKYRNRHRTELEQLKAA